MGGRDGARPPRLAGRTRYGLVEEAEEETEEDAWDDEYEDDEEEADADELDEEEDDEDDVELTTTVPPVPLVDENARADDVPVADALEDEAASPAHRGDGCSALAGSRSRLQPTRAATTSPTTTTAVNVVRERAWRTVPPQYGHLNVRCGRECPQ